MPKDSAFKDEWGDLEDDKLAGLASKFAPAPAVDTPAADKAAEKQIKAADRVAANQGFSTPAKRKKKPKFRRSDQLRTGRNEIITIKGRLEDKERLSAIADDREWVNGQTLQYALDALTEKIENPEDKFWESRNFHGVE